MPLSAPDIKTVKDLIEASTKTIVETNNSTLKGLIKSAVSAAVAEANKAFNDELTRLNDIIEETRDNVTALQNKLIEKEERIASLELKVATTSKSNIELSSKLNEATDRGETYSRKDCLRIEGLPYSADEDNASLQKKVIAKLKENKVTISKGDIFRLHRSGKPYPLNQYKKFAGYDEKDIDKKDKSTTAQVIIKFTNWEARSKVYNIHYDQNSDIHVNCDLSKYQSDLLKSARAYIKDNNRKGYAYNDSECRLIVRDVDRDQRRPFTNISDLKKIADNMIVDADFHKKK